MATLASRLTDLAGAIRDKLNLMTPRLLPSGGSTGQVLAKSSGTDYAVGWVAASGGGGSNKIITEVDFGLGSSVEFVDVTAAWVTIDSVLRHTCGAPTTSDHGPEDAMLEGLRAETISINPGVGFTLGVYAPNSTWGRHNIVTLGE